MKTKMGWLLSLCLGIYSVSNAQDVVDVWAWGNAGAHAAIDSSAWAADATYMYIRNQNASRFFLHAGSVYVTRQLGMQGWSVAVGYAFGRQAQMGVVHLGQLRLNYNRFQWRLRPTGRLTIDRLWIAAPPSEATTAPIVDRVLLLVGIEPPLSPVWTLLVNTEPFLLRNGLFFREVRSQAGLRWQKMDHLKIELVYFNRWVGFSGSTIRWQHAGNLSAIVLVGSGQ